MAARRPSTLHLREAHRAASWSMRRRSRRHERRGDRADYHLPQSVQPMDAIVHVRGSSRPRSQSSVDAERERLLHTRAVER